jgi:hypothetical protein
VRLEKRSSRGEKQQGKTAGKNSREKQQGKTAGKNSREKQAASGHTKPPDAA